MRSPGIEPGSSAWEAPMITITLHALREAAVDAAASPKRLARQKTMSSQMGLEPTIFGSGNRRLVHLATGTLAPPVGLEPTISPLGGVRLIH